MHTVVEPWCIGCELCLPPCPVDCIDMVPARGEWTHGAASAPPASARRSASARLKTSAIRRTGGPQSESSPRPWRARSAMNPAEARARSSAASSAANPNPTTELKYGTPFELLVAVVLSAQATDKSVNLATARAVPEGEHAARRW